MDSQAVTINSRLFDGSIGKSWTCKIVEQDGPLLVFVGVFDREVAHEHLGVIRRGTISYEYYWLDRWYNVFRFHEPDGEFRNYYCNINMLPTFDGRTLDYVDLDLDILVGKDGAYTILDLDEFEENAAKYHFSDDLRANVNKAVDDLTELIKTRQFPFDH
jgi:protein associated with RNAse G/E